MMQFELTKGDSVKILSPVSEIYGFTHNSI